MGSFDNIKQLPAGASFVRGDLHIHSTSGSHDVKDALMTPANIVAEAEKEGLSLIAITDHNEIPGVAEAIEAAMGTSVIVIPGVELSTPEGHLLVYFRTLNALQRLYSRLEFEDLGTDESRCTTSMLQVLKEIDPEEGFAILAHVDGGKGLETMLPGGAPHKRDILCQRSLVGIELKSAASTISYSDEDDDNVRRNLGAARIRALDLGQRQHLARVLFSDSHSLDQLGRNSQANRKVTRFKLQGPSYDGLRMALMFADARVRIEDEIPDAIPHIEGVELSGGFLDGQHVRFSRNLTCIIGGRGTGKSTLIEVTRSIAEMASQSKLVDSDVWPDTFGVCWRDPAGAVTTITRQKHEGPENADNPFGVTSFPIECYSQNEISIQSHPSELLRFVDQFADFSDKKEADEAARQALLENQELIEDLDREVRQLPDNRKWLANVERQFEALKAARGREIIELEQKLAEERETRRRVQEVVQETLSEGAGRPEQDLIRELAELPTEERMKVGKKPMRSIREAAVRLGHQAESHRDDLQALLKAFDVELRAQIQAWSAEEARIRRLIQAKRTELEEQGVRLDMNYIRKLAKDHGRFSARVKELEKKERELKRARLDRAKLVTHRRSCRDAISAIRDGYAMQATRALRGTLGDLALTVKFRRGSLSPDAESIVAQALNWRTSRVPRARKIVSELSIPRLLDAIQTKDTSALTALQEDADQVFTTQQAREILETLGKEEHRHLLERCVVEDLPQILITAKPAGHVKPVTRGFARLSLGQQQSILLSLMLTSNSRQPLIIDQPEDNLDGEFIYRSLVAALRRAKERRQVIIVTHNPNIAVLGDAEQVIVLKSFNDRGQVVAAESIDDKKARDLACEVLEGTAEAFRRRMHIYGL